MPLLNRITAAVDRAISRLYPSAAVSSARRAARSGARTGARHVNRPRQASFGDYQCSAAMPLAKQMGERPEVVAAALAGALPELVGVCEPVEITKPGFLNFRLRPSYVEAQLGAMQQCERLGVPMAEAPERVVVDFSSPNVAKAMHVGHLRSTILGDSISRVLEFMGHDVLRLNHVGDWGTQFGMLITWFEQMEQLEQLKVQREGRERKGGEGVGNGVGVGTGVSSDEGTEGEHTLASPGASAVSSLGDVESIEASPLEASPLEASPRPGDLTGDITASSIGDLYRSAKQRFDKDEAFRDASRLAVVRLQGGEDMECVALWEQLCSMSRVEFNGIYNKLGVDIEERGESFYNALLDDTVDGVEAAGVATLSRGAMCAFPPDGRAGKEETPPPLILRKGDGGYTYAATDLAAIRHRIDVEKATRLVYVTDQGQKRHFEQVFWTAREAGIVPQSSTVALEHVPFGLVLRKDGKKLQTRSGENIPLVDMLDEATTRARARLVETTAKRGVEETEAYLDSSAAIIGIGAAKYNDLSRRCTDDYKLSYDTMLALTGNTSSYIQYSCVRATSILRRAKEGKEGEQGTDGKESKEWKERRERRERSTVHPTPSTKGPGGTSEGAPLTATTSTSSTIIPATTTAVDIDTCMSPIRLLEAEEIALGRELVRFHDAIDDTGNELSPQRLCSFAYDVSQAFNRFYEACPIMSCESPEAKASRLALCSLTGRTLTQTMGLLGIGVVERM